MPIWEKFTSKLSAPFVIVNLITLDLLSGWRRCGSRTGRCSERLGGSQVAVGHSVWRRRRRRGCLKPTGSQPGDRQ